MIEARSGKIVTFSGGGATWPRPNFSAYAASKAAVVRLTETLAHEVQPYNIQVNAIAPGAIDTRMIDVVLTAGQKAGQKDLEEARRVRAGQSTSPDRVVELALFLASAASDGLTGRLISAAWDDWSDSPSWVARVMDSDLYTLRRNVPRKDLPDA
jgi:NAD(P)-dependent dehydrogenase (short-subunit alcohol dehydrogenase family)